MGGIVTSVCLTGLELPKYRRSPNESGTWGGLARRVWTSIERILLYLASPSWKFTGEP